MLKLLLPFMLIFTALHAQIDQPKKYRILTMDGGGIRGVLTAKLILMLHKETKFLKYVDLYGGTSTGSFLAAGLALGKHPSLIVDLYRNHGQEIFQPSHRLDPLGIYAKYDAVILEQVMLKYGFPHNPILSDVPAKVVIPAFRISSVETHDWAPVIFDNFQKNRTRLLDALLASSAAPTYFPSHMGCIDGGVMANNPSMIALCAAIDPSKGGQHLAQIRLLSIGTGMDKHSIDGDVNWGVAEWLIYNPFANESTPAHPMIDIFTGAASRLAHHQAQQVLGEQYRRLNPLLSHTITLDNWQNVDELLAIAEHYPLMHPQEWKELVEWVSEEFCDD